MYWRPNTSYLISNIIRTTPNRQRTGNQSSSSQFNSVAGRNRGCAINESVERPLPSSVVDSEGVAKKIARLNSDGFMCSSSVDNLWGSSGKLFVNYFWKPDFCCFKVIVKQVYASEKNPSKRIFLQWFFSLIIFLILKWNSSNSMLLSKFTYICNHLHMTAILLRKS